MAAEAGAVALLTLKSPEREQFSPWERARQARPLRALGWTDPAQSENRPMIKATITLGPELARSLFAQAGRDVDNLGSDYFVAHPPVPLNNIVAAISVDGLMAFHDFAGIVALGAEHSTLGEISLAAARSIDAIHVPDPIPGRGKLALSDQYPFLRVGIPVLFPNPARGSSRDGSADIAAWDDYESRHYHQPSDDMRLPLRWDVAERWGQYIYVVVAGASNAPQVKERSLRASLLILKKCNSAYIFPPCPPDPPPWVRC